MNRTLLSFQDVQHRLQEYSNYERTAEYPPGMGGLGTARIERLLRLLGDPHLDVPVIHIAGTKGKGTTGCMTARLLQTLGYRVGVYASPHVYQLLERIQVDGRPVEEFVFCEAFSALLPALDAMSGDPPTYFEVMTALAYRTFSDAKLDVAVVEVGLGGRLDATNVSSLPVLVSGITPISLDHMAQLGNTLIEIAGEKAGILRKETPVVIAAQEPHVMEYLKERADALGSQVRVAGEDVVVGLRERPLVNHPASPQRMDLTSWIHRHEDVPLGMMGRHQLDNAAMALGLTEIYLERTGRKPVDTASLRASWRTLSVPGRIELVQTDPTVICDGAHNPASAWALSETLRDRFECPKKVLVFSAAKDKDISTILRILLPGFDSVVLTQYPHPRCMDVMTVAKEVLTRHESVDLEVVINPQDALALAKTQAGESGLVCVTGSLYLPAAVRGIE